MISYYHRTGRRKLGGLCVKLPPSGTCDTGVACRRIGCGFLPSVGLGCGLCPSVDPGCGFCPSADSGFVFRPSDDSGFALWPFRTVFRPQMDWGRTLVVRMAKTRTLDALRCSRWPKSEPGMRGCSCAVGRDRAAGSGPQPRSGPRPRHPGRTGRMGIRRGSRFGRWAQVPL